MGSTELSANLFRATQAEEKLRRDKIPLSKFNIPEEIRKILQSGKLDPEFTTTQIRALLPEPIRENIETSRVIDTLSKTLTPLVTNTKRKLGGNHLYVLNK